MSDSGGVECRLVSYANIVTPHLAVIGDVMPNVAERIDAGLLPRTLEDWPAGWVAKACSPDLSRDWAGWCRAWWEIAYVRMQAFERDADAEWAAEDWEAAHGEE